MRYDLTVEENQYRQLATSVFPLYDDDQLYSRRFFSFWLMGIGRQYLYAVKHIVVSLVLFAVGALAGTATRQPLLIVTGAVCWLLASTPGFAMLFLGHEDHPRAIRRLTIATAALWLAFFAIELYLAGRQH